MVRFWAKPPVWQWPYRASKLPECYYQYNQELNSKPTLRIHDRPPKTDYFDLRKTKTGAIERVADIPIDSFKKVPAQDTGLWGGEQIILGFTKAKRIDRPVPRSWWPHLQVTTMYSEILNQYFVVHLTDSTLRQIDDAFGFDSYILKTSIPNLNSKLAVKLKRRMYLNLANPENLYPDDPKKREEILARYKEHILPKETAEWWGLDFQQALTKQKIIEHSALPSQQRPLKEIFTKQLVDRLQALKEEGQLTQTDETSLIHKLKKRFHLLPPVYKS